MVQIDEEIKEVVDRLKTIGYDTFYGSILTKYEAGKRVHTKVEISMLHGGENESGERNQSKG